MKATHTRVRAAGNLHNAQDVLQDHHMKNRRPRAPDMEVLETLRQHATDPTESSEEEVPEPRSNKSTAQNEDNDDGKSFYLSASVVLLTFQSYAHTCTSR